MKYALYVIAGLVVIGATLNIASVGKPRKPITPGLAAGMALWNAAIVTILVLAAGRL